MNDFPENYFLKSTNSFRPKHARISTQPMRAMKVRNPWKKVPGYQLNNWVTKSRNWTNVIIRAPATPANRGILGSFKKSIVVMFESYFLLSTAACSMGRHFL